MANTSFLDLVKPAGTDKALVSVINSNSDKIDAGVSTLSEQIATYNCGSKTVQEFVTAIEQLGATMANGGVKNIYVQISSASTPFEQATYSGTLRRNYSDRYDVILFTNASTKIIVGAKSSSGWAWQQLATADQLSVSFNNACTYNSDIISSGSPIYHKFGRVVVVSIDITLSQAVSTSGTVLLRNLPQSGGNVWVSLVGYNDNKAYRLRLSGTELTTFYSNTLPAQVYNGFIAYIANS